MLKTQILDETAYLLNLIIKQPNETCSYKENVILKHTVDILKNASIFTKNQPPWFYLLNRSEIVLVVTNKHKHCFVYILYFIKISLFVILKCPFLSALHPIVKWRTYSQKKCSLLSVSCVLLAKTTFNLSDWKV